jgi:hypothetical protein
MSWAHCINADAGFRRVSGVVDVVCFVVVVGTIRGVRYLFSLVFGLMLAISRGGTAGAQPSVAPPHSAEHYEFVIDSVRTESAATPRVPERAHRPVPRGPVAGLVPE